MFNGLAFLGLIGAVTQLFKEATEKKQPYGSRVDWVKVDEDERNGVSYEEYCRRMRKGYYHTTEPKKYFDLMAYRQDVLDGATPDELEQNRKNMKYGYLKPVGYDHRANYTTEGCPSDIIVDVERYEYQRRKFPHWFSDGRLLRPHEYWTFRPKYHDGDWDYYVFH